MGSRPVLGGIGIFFIGTLPEEVALGAVATCGVLIVVSILAIRSHFRQLIRDETFDQLLAERIDTIKASILQTIGLDEEELAAEPVSVVLSPSAIRHKRMGKDGRIRVNPLRFVVLLVGIEQFIHYDAEHDVISGDVGERSLSEAYYDNVVSATERTSDDGEVFELQTSGSTIIPIPLTYIPQSDADRIIRAIRRMLREKRTPRRVVADTDSDLL